jgi:hypothetical protein
VAAEVARVEAAVVVAQATSMQVLRTKSSRAAAAEPVDGSRHPAETVATTQPPAREETVQVLALRWVAWEAALAWAVRLALARRSAAQGVLATAAPVARRLMAVASVLEQATVETQPTTISAFATAGAAAVVTAEVVRAMVALARPTVVRVVVVVAAQVQQAECSP